jgi:hypothetical protein
MTRPILRGLAGIGAIVGIVRPLSTDEFQPVFEFLQVLSLFENLGTLSFGNQNP